MGRQRDPNRNKAKEIFAASGEEIRLTDIASQLNVSGGIQTSIRKKKSLLPKYLMMRN